MQSAEQIIRRLEEAGFRAAFLPISAMEQVQAHYDSMPARGPDTAWLRGIVGKFRSSQPARLEFEPRSILVAACPCTGAALVLHRRGESIKIPIPPGYVDVSKVRRRMEETLAAAEGYRQAETVGISLKLLAALSGLGQYGRNNICYVGGWGGYCRLEARYTNVPCEGPIQESLRMPACENCGLCRRACPTGAIGEAQVIDAARCLCHLNEHKIIMPRWVPKGAHHTLIGCMRCQECCPQNPTLDYSYAINFDEAETRQLLSRGNKLPKALKEKILAFGYEDWAMPNIKRNARRTWKALR